MGTVTRFWRGAEVTKTSAKSVVTVVQPVSLDVLSDQVARAMNDVVRRQAELGRAELHLEHCQQAWVNRMLEVAQQSGIKDFTMRRLPSDGDEE